jgi:hypothetical protein
METVWRVHLDLWVSDRDPRTEPVDRLRETIRAVPRLQRTELFLVPESNAWPARTPSSP